MPMDQDLWILNDIEIAYFISVSAIVIVSRYSIPEAVSLSSLQFQVSHNTSLQSTAVSGRLCGPCAQLYGHSVQSMVIL